MTIGYHQKAARWGLYFLQGERIVKMNRILISVVMLTASMATFAAEAPDANR
jgi:hypothetical protein